MVSFFAAQGISTSRLQALVSYGETRPLIATPGPEQQNRRTVTEVSGFVKSYSGLLDGKYAQVIYREYISSAIPGSAAVAAAGAAAPEAATAPAQ